MASSSELIPELIRCGDISFKDESRSGRSDDMDSDVLVKMVKSIACQTPEGIEGIFQIVLSTISRYMHHAGFISKLNC